MERTIEQIREHYEIEKVLADRLMNSSQEERRLLYSSLYDELFRRVPHHPQLTRKKNDELSKNYVSKQVDLLRRFLRNDTIFVEIGPGDCSLSFALTTMVKKVYAIDVSDEISKNEELPDNFQLMLSDGVSIPIPKKSADLVYSNQLMEHLHPEDAENQLINIVDVLADGGKYICITPNRISGPHDISRHFDKEATGFHLKEYTFEELRNLFKKVGFKTVHGYWRVRKICAKIPVFLIILTERLLNFLPLSIKRNKYSYLLLRITIVGIK